MFGTIVGDIMTFSRNNHYVPQMYLKQWELEDRILVYNILVPNENFPLWKEQAIKHTASIKDLYTDVEQNIEYDRTERVFSEKYESLAKSPLEKACLDGKMGRKDWEILIDFVVLQFVRTPMFYMWIIEHGKEIAMPVLDEIANLLSEMKSPPDPSTIEKVRSVNIPVKIQKVKDDPSEETIDLEIKTVVGKNTWLSSIDAFLQEESMVRGMFHNLKWSIVTACDGYSWPTCDNPVVLCDILQGMIHRVPLNAGVWRKHRAILFPISPQKVLIGEVHRTIRWREKVNNSLSASIKESICDNAFRFIYSNNKDSDVVMYRKRVVDLDLYMHVKNQFDTWYENYKLNEGKYLN